MVSAAMAICSLRYVMTGEKWKTGRPKKTFKKVCTSGLRIKVHKYIKRSKATQISESMAGNPETARTIAETDIHANHAEAFWSALRRKMCHLSTQDNTYAKATKGLQRLLRVYWVVHNFLRVHFTTEQFPLSL